MDNTHELSFYASPGPMTDLSSCPPEVLDGLPADPAGLMKVVRGCVTSDLILQEVYKVPVPERDDAQIRPAADMVARMLEIDPRRLRERRKPQDRFIGNCRHFATMSCALLRRAGIPTRVRAGFAAYFEPGTWTDHWIIEYWRPEQSRWGRVDPELDDEWVAKRSPGTTSESLAQSMYLSGGEAWRRCRAGELDPGTFKMGVTWGLGEVRGSVLFDLAALNQDETLPWDIWGQMKAAYASETDDVYDGLLDHVADVTMSGDLDAIRALYEQTPDLKVPVSISGR
jgi:transglutaminase-like putative cysteine protease